MQSVDLFGITLLLLVASICTFADGQLLQGVFGIEVSAQAALQDGTVVAELTVQIPSDTVLSPTLEVEYEPDSNTRSRNQIIFIKVLSSLNNSRTPEGYVAYQIDGLEQDELYIMHIQEFQPGTGVIQLSDEFFLFTTGVQSITAEAGFEDAVVTCHFLLGARADGCLVEWSEVNSTDSSNGTLLISRANDSLVANGTITGLQENTTYTVRAFSTRAGANLNEFVPIVLPSDLVTLERPTEAAVTLPDTNNTTVSDSLVPSVNTTVAVNGGDTTAPVRNTETTVLLVAIPTAVGGFFLILGVTIAVITCIVSLRILRKRKQKAAQYPEHGNIQTEQNILNTAPCYEQVNIHTQQHILKQKVMNNKAPHPENEVYNQRNILKHKAGNTAPCPEHDNIQTQLNILRLKQQALSSTVPCPGHDGNIPTQQNTCYELSGDETAIDPPLYDEVDVQPTSPTYAVADADSHAGTSAGEEEDEYYVNDSLPSHPNIKKSSSLGDHEIVVEENNAYNATITHSQTPVYDDGIYY